MSAILFGCKSAASRQETNDVQVVPREERAREVLIEALGGKLPAGKLLVFDNETVIDDYYYWAFALGTNASGQFIAEVYYMVTDDDKVYWYDALRDIYIPVRLRQTKE